MPRINILDEDVARLIAAGEVVERPASVVKELVENAIDAKATKISIEIENGGISYLRVSDNGCGIEKEDIKKAFMPHATSKVKDKSDLEAIMTMGFRGEALASISAVAKVTLISKTSNQLVGTKYCIENSKQLCFEDVGAAEGTTIVVEDLFFNVPARMKFLKKDVTEANAVANVVDKLALSHPEISFSFIRNSKEIFNTSGNDSVKSAIYSVYGKAFSDELIKLDYNLDGIMLKGYISKPFKARSNRKMQVFFINSRYIKSQIISVALERAYKGLILTGKFPQAVLYINLPPQLTDINVHPAKTEVKFSDEKKIFDCVYYAVKTALLNDSSKEQISLGSDNAKFDEPQVKISTKSFDDITSKDYCKPDEPVENEKNELNDEDKVKENENNIKESLFYVPSEYTKVKYNKALFLEDQKEEPELFMPPKRERNKRIENGDIFDMALNRISDNEEDIKEYQYQEKNDNIKYVQEALPSFEQIKTPDASEKTNDQKFIGEAFSTYIIMQQGDEVLFIDKHAAHERLIYEKLKNTQEGNFLQTLLQPEKVVLDKMSYDLVLENQEVLCKAGFETDDFGNGVILVRTVPLILSKADVQEVFLSAVEALRTPDSSAKSDYLYNIYHSVACKSAIKANDINSNEELMELACKIQNENCLEYCPHGRPIIITLSKKEIEKKFKRS